MPILVPNRDERPASQAQLARLFAVLRSAGLEREDLDHLMVALGLGDDLAALTRLEYDELVMAVESFGSAA